MPKYTLSFPDGYEQAFDGPAGMSDMDVFNRGVQERAFKEGKIPSSYWAGAGKALGEDKVTTGALIGGAGMLTGTAPLVAAAPLISEGIKYGTQKLTGQQPPVPSAQTLGLDAAEGIATAYGPAALQKSGSVIKGAIGKLAGNTLPQAATQAGVELLTPMMNEAGKASPQAVGGTVKELTEMVKQLGTRVRGGISADEVQLMRDQVAAGMKPSTAARIIASKDPQKMSALMKLYMRPSVGLK